MISRRSKEITLQNLATRLFHCLRHGFCSALSDSGKEINQIANLAGHKSIQTTMRYIHQGSEQKRKIVDELAQAFCL